MYESNNIVHHDVYCINIFLLILQEGSGTGRAKTDPFSLQVEDETVVRGKSPAFLSKMEKSK